MATGAMRRPVPLGAARQVVGDAAADDLPVVGGQGPAGRGACATDPRCRVEAPAQGGSAAGGGPDLGAARAPGKRGLVADVARVERLLLTNPQVAEPKATGGVPDRDPTVTGDRHQPVPLRAEGNPVDPLGGDAPDDAGGLRVPHEQGRPPVGDGEQATVGRVGGGADRDPERRPGAGSAAVKLHQARSPVGLDDQQLGTIGSQDGHAEGVPLAAVGPVRGSRTASLPSSPTHATVPSFGETARPGRMLASVWSGMWRPTCRAMRACWRRSHRARMRWLADTSRSRPPTKARSVMVDPIPESGSVTKPPSWDALPYRS